VSRAVSAVILSEAKDLGRDRLTQRGDELGSYYVYILTNKSRTLYTGVTNDLERRVSEHKQKLIPGFTRKYNISRLVFFEVTPDVRAAISREKQIKGWTRTKKIALIESENPRWRDLSVDWHRNSAPEILRPSASE
jgi:putative endonuclease